MLSSYFTFLKNASSFYMQKSHNFSAKDITAIDFISTVKLLKQILN